MDNRTNIINNLHSNLGKKLAEKLTFKSPFQNQINETSIKPKPNSVIKPGTSISRKALNQVLTKIMPHSATNATSKYYKPFTPNMASFHEGSMSRPTKQNYSIDHKDSSQKHLKRNNLSLNIEQNKGPAFAYGFSNGQPSPVDKL